MRDIENVPCKKCDQCGEEFFTVSVMKKIDVILSKYIRKVIEEQ